MTVQARLSSLAAIRGEAYVAAANPDAKRVGKPVPSSPFDGNAGGLSTWDLDAINVTANPGAGRSIDVDGTGVYVAVIDTGLLSSWRFYFPEERIATDLARVLRRRRRRGGQRLQPAEQVADRPGLARHTRHEHDPRLQPAWRPDQRRGARRHGHPGQGP